MRRLPVLAIMLGLLGLIPFLACAAGIIFVPHQVPVPRLVQALIAYGAVILSFLGAVHWGLALEPDPTMLSPSRTAADRKRLALGVLPALVGWAALLVPLVASSMVAIIILAMGFLGTMLVEAEAGRRGALPPGYLPLRWLLSAVVLLCLLVVLVARTF